MTKPNNLVIGQHYFFCTYIDLIDRIPLFKTYVFLGKNLYPDKVDYTEEEYFFQEVESYYDTGSYLEKKAGKKYEVIIFSKDVIYDLVELDGLIEILTNLNINVNKII